MGDRHKRDADAIRSATTQMVEEIRTVLPCVEPGKPLVVNIGVNHHNPNHIIAEIDLARRLRDEGVCFAYAAEQAENSLELDVAHHYQGLRKERILAHLQTERGQELRSVYAPAAASLLSRRASVSKNLLVDVFRRWGVPIALVDSHRVYDFTKMDMRDVATMGSVKEAARLLGYDPEKITRDHPSVVRLNYGSGDMTRDEEAIGIVSRNVHMKQACDALSEQLRDVQVILLRTGRLHVAGDEKREFLYTGSLADIYSGEGQQPYLGMILYSSGIDQQGALWQQSEQDDRLHHFLVSGPQDFGATSIPSWSPKPEAKHIVGVSKHLELTPHFNILFLATAVGTVQSVPEKLRAELGHALDEIAQSPEP